MKRWIAGLFLVLIAFYVGASHQDRCIEGPSDCGQVCHIICADGCATAPMPVAPVAPPPDPEPVRSYASEQAEHLVSLKAEPEKDPPRV